MTSPVKAEDSSTRDPMTGRLVLGRYRVIDALAQGGMGMVYLGRTEGAAGFSRPVVIKRVLPQLLGDPSIGKMFVREARILSNLRHPGIVGVIDFGEEDRAYVMVLEYVHGFDAAQWLNYLNGEKRRVPPDIALYIAVSILDALHYAHNLKRTDGTTMQVVHRDISPGNILLDTEANVRLSDFGIARIDNEAAEYRTQETTFKGKLGYSHPLLLSQGEPSVQTDVYSASVVLFQLLTGVNPFRGKSAAETVNRVVNLPLPKLSDYWSDVHPEVEAAVLKGMARKPSEAFPDAQSFARTLRGLMSRAEKDIATDMREILVGDFSRLPHVIERRSLEDRDEAWRRSIPCPERRPLISTRTAGPEVPTIVGSIARSNETTLHGAPTEPGREMTAPGSETNRGGRGQKMLAGAIVVLALAVIGAAVIYSQSDDTKDAASRYVVVSKEASSTMSEGVAEPPVDGPPAANSAMTDENQDDTVAAPGASSTQATKQPGVSSSPVARKPDPQYFTQVFSRRQPAVQKCVANAGAEEMNVQVSFKVDTQGRVTEASLSPAGTSSTPAGQCILRVARAVSFGPLTETASFRIPVSARRQ